jgi:predicted transcriptional regulator
MGPVPESHPAKPSTKGLATVALLKANFDAGKDHLEMFQPFVRDCIGHLDRDDFVVDDLKAAIHSRHGLDIPADTLRTLLGRLVRKEKSIKREAGRYFRLERAAAVDLATARAAVEGRQRIFAQALVEFAEKKKLRLGSPDDALAILLQFLDRYHVSLALSEPEEGASVEPDLEGDSTRRRPMVIVAAFLSDVVVRDGALASTLQEMLEGFVLQNALFLKDVSAAARRFENLEVFLDTALLLAALGLTGEAAQVAMNEALRLLRDTGARLAAFDVTLKEVRRILAVYEEHLATSEGRLKLHPTEVTMFVLARRYAPSDIRQIDALLERRLLDLGINVRPLPARRRDWTLDEPSLIKSLSSHKFGPMRRAGFDARVHHDVDCVAGVLVLRAGKRTDSLDHSRAVFATASWLTLNKTTEWFQKQEHDDVAPLVHHLTLSNLAWLKKPSSAVRLKLHELVALCGAVLVPSRKLWENFVSHLRRLREAGELTSDEVTAIVASRLTSSLLVEQETDDGDLDAESVSEVVERVKATYREESDRAVAQADQRARDKEDEARRIRAGVEAQATRVARWVCKGLTWVAVPSLFAGMVLSIPGVTTRPAPWNWIPVVLFLVPSLMSVLWGFNLRGWRQRFQERLGRTFQKWMMGS